MENNNSKIKLITFISTILFSIILSVSKIILDTKYLDSLSQQYDLNASKYVLVLKIAIIVISCLYILLLFFFKTKFSSSTEIVYTNTIKISGILLVVLPIISLLSVLIFGLFTKNDSILYKLAYIISVILFVSSGLILFLYNKISASKPALLLLLAITPISYSVLFFFSSDYTINNLPRLICCFAFIMFALFFSFILKERSYDQKESKFSFIISQLGILYALILIITDFYDLFVLKLKFTSLLVLELAIIPYLIIAINYSIKSLKNSYQK